MDLAVEGITSRRMSTTSAASGARRRLPCPGQSTTRRLSPSIGRLRGRRKDVRWLERLGAPSFDPGRLTAEEA